VKRRFALAALRGIGLEALQWEDDRPAAYHIRRRLTDLEAVPVGGVCDLRGSIEGWARFDRLKTSLPLAVQRVALQELESPDG
jgi:hypothetical protein